MNEMTPADYAAINGGGFGGNNMWPWLLAGNGGGFGGFGGGGIFWVLILFVLAMFGWGGGGFGGGGTGAAQNYVLASDMSMMSRQISDGFNSQERRTDAIINGISDAAYATLGNFNNTNTNIMQQGFGLQSAISGVGAQMAGYANGLTRAVEQGFCGTQYRDLENTNALMQAGHGDADRILARLDQMENSRKDEKIAQLTQENLMWQQRANADSQTDRILRELGYQCPKPAYVVQPPRTVTFPQRECDCNGTWG